MANKKLQLKAGKKSPLKMNKSIVQARMVLSSGPHSCTIVRTNAGHVDVKVIEKLGDAKDQVLYLVPVKVLRAGKEPKTGDIAITSNDIADEIANATNPDQIFHLSSVWNKTKAANYINFVSQEDSEILAMELELDSVNNTTGITA